MGGVVAGRARDRTAVWITTTYAISTNQVVRSSLAYGEVYSIQQLRDKAYQRHVTGLLFSPSTLDSSTNKTDRHDIDVIWLKVAFNTIILTL